ncbi:hypothetical protein AB4865_07205 [Capnocytophaga sp. ARDL2]|uniref:hypothetical protein n=1 Tax=Capnocytophaga sp. ARDL2 TaxID=3238809 RepID=UPI003557BEA2
MEPQHYTPQQAEQLFTTFERFGFKRVKEINNRIYYQKGEHLLIYRKGYFYMGNKSISSFSIDDDGIRSVLYYTRSSEKQFLNKFIIEEEPDKLKKTYALKWGIEEQLKYINNICEYHFHTLTPVKREKYFEQKQRLENIIKEIEKIELYG